MSQAASPDLEPPPDLSSPPAGPLQQDTDSCRDVPATFGSASSPESLIHHESAGDMSTVDTCTGEPAEATNETETETPAERRVVECDQPVSLDPERTEEVETLPKQDKGWSGWSSWGKSLLTSATSTVGQSLTSVKTKAGEALRLHRASVGEEALEEEEEGEEGAEQGGGGGGGGGEGGGGETKEPDVSSCEESSVSAAAPGRGVFSTLTHAVQNTGKSVISGGLDALEFIGKKTMTVLAESDPGFKKTKTLMQKTASLSQMLKEAKEKERARLGAAATSAPTAHYGLLFDDYQGLSHLEALEILSNESDVKVQACLSSLEEEELEEMRKELVFIKNIFIKQEEEEEKTGDAVEGVKGEGGGQTKDQADSEEFASVLTELLFELHVAATPDKLNKARLKAHDWVREVEQPSSGEAVGTETEEGASPFGSGSEEEKEEGEKEEVENEEGADGKEEEPRSVEAVYMSSVGSLAEVTARSIEQLHKVAELILHGQDLEKAAREQADILSRLTQAMCAEVDCLAKKFCDTLVLVGAQRKAEQLNPLVSTVLLEGSNSTNYIQNAFQLLLPILQISHMQSQKSQSSTDAATHRQH